MNENLENRLFAKGINPTAMRLLVLEYLLQQPSAVSLSNLEKYFHYSDRTTLFRTLKTFEEKGLLHQIKDGTDSTKYALCATACQDSKHTDSHLHFYCTSCRETFCLPGTSIPQIILPDNFMVKELNLVATGICNACTANNATMLHDYSQ